MNLTLMDSALIINGVVSSCQCKCRHCLLSSGDRLVAPVPFEKLQALAMKFEGFKKSTGVDVGLAVYHSADYPQLPAAMEVDRKISRISGYQNLNGTPIRKGKELAEWVSYLKYDCKVEHANLSWFGTREFHDYFVQAPGYFDYLLDLAAELKRQQIDFHNSVFILKSNIDQLQPLHEVLESVGGTMHYSLMDYRGRAKDILNEFLDDEAVSRFPKFLQDSELYNKKRNRMNSEWVKAVKEHQAPSLARRLMFLVATPENVETYLKMQCSEILAMFHQLDENLQSLIPGIEFLASVYGTQSEEVLLDYRSALWKWMDMFFEDRQLDKSLLFSDLYTSVMWR